MTYQELLDVFWAAHSPTRRPWSRQYASAIFYHSEEQRRLAEASKERQEAKLGRKLYTEIVPAGRFWVAEDYHQKYSLRGASHLWREFEAIYVEDGAIIDSTAAARVNGYLGGYGKPEHLREEIASYGLSPEASKRLLAAAGSARRGC